MNKNKLIFTLFTLSLLISLISSSTGAGGTDYLEEALQGLCTDISSLIPIIAMLLVISAGVIYTAGQWAGAETRARANVWATSCLTGAVIGIIIATVAPCILGQIAGTGGCLDCGGS